MDSSSASGLIKSLEDLEVMDGNADSLSEGDLVFAKAKGYIPWPGILEEKQSSSSVVNFLGTDDSRKINNLKIWPYSECKAQFITPLNLEYEEFRDAILIAEKLSSELENNEDSGAYFYRVLKKDDQQKQNDQEKQSQEEASQEEASKEEASQEEASQKEASKEKPSKEEPSQEEVSKEEPSKEKPIKKEPSKDESKHEKPCKEEPKQQPDNLEELGYGEIDAEEEDMSIKYVQFLRSNRDSLNGGVEKKFIELVNVLRSSLKINQKDYPSAVLALQELLEMTFSELLLVRNFEAANSIYCVSLLDTAHQNFAEAAQVKVLAKQLMSRFDLVFGLPDINVPFIDYLRSLSSIYMRYTYDLEPMQCEFSQEALDEKVAGQKALDVKEETLVLAELLEDQDVLAIELEEKFDQQIDILRRSLSFRRKDYPSALLAFEELLSMTFTKEFLYPKYKDVNFIYYVSRSGSVLPWSGLAKATLVRSLANQLMARILSVFNIQGTTSYDFMIRFGALYSNDDSDSSGSSESEAEAESGAESEAESGAESEAESEANSEAESGANSEAESEANSETISESGTE